MFKVRRSSPKNSNRRSVGPITTRHLHKSTCFLMEARRRRRPTPTSSRTWWWLSGAGCPSNLETATRLSSRYGSTSNRPTKSTDTFCGVFMGISCINPPSISRSKSPCPSWRTPGSRSSQPLRNTSEWRQPDSWKKPTSTTSWNTNGWRTWRSSERISIPSWSYWRRASAIPAKAENELLLIFFILFLFSPFFFTPLKI